MRLSTLCVAHEEMDFNGADDDAFVALANQLALGGAEYVLMPADCSGIRMINRVRARLCLKIAATPDAAALECLDDKWHFHLLCKRLKLNVPKTQIFDDKHKLEYSSAAECLGTPFVIKPLNEDASRGMHVIRQESEYRRLILDNPAYRYAPLIAQRFIAGDDVGLNFCAAEGKVIVAAMQKRLDPSHDGSRIEFFFNRYMLKAACSIARATNYTGVMNVDARIEAGTGKVFLFESNPRFWRSLSASVWCGINFAAACLEPPYASKRGRLLTSGMADTYYHPLFQPALWKYLLSGSTRQVRMTRIMACDLPVLMSSAKTICTRRAGGGFRALDSLVQKYRA
jgi:predicted ATP-grasp superfamily ATP-dependent carboligase